MTRLFAALRSAVYASAFVAVWGWVVVTVRPWDARWGLAPPEWVRLPGRVLIVLGAALALWCIGAFSLIGRGTPAPFDAPRETVVAGPYRWVRNPMYLAGASILLGVGLALRSLAAVAVAAFFLVLAHFFVLGYEEPTLERRFGDSYREYKNEVNRWWPRRPGGGSQEI